MPRAIAQLNGATVGSRYLKVSEASGQGARAAVWSPFWLIPLDVA